MELLKQWLNWDSIDIGGVTISMILIEESLTIVPLLNNDDALYPAP